MDLRDTELHMRHWCMARLVGVGLTELYYILRNIDRCDVNAKRPVIKVAGMRDTLFVTVGRILVDYLGAGV